MIRSLPRKDNYIVFLSQSQHKVNHTEKTNKCLLNRGGDSDSKPSPEVKSVQLSTNTGCFTQVQKNQNILRE